MRQRILVIAPPSLLKQWEIELSEKFSLPTLIIDSNELKKIEKKHKNPFNQSGIVLLTSYQFAKNKSEYLKRAPIDLVVFDEAHKLRNLTQTTIELKKCFNNSKKILLTATPLQNSAKDIYNLCSFIDPDAFGGLRAFNFLVENDGETAREFLSLYLHRRLRSDVSNYLKYPKRFPETYNFTFTPEEDKLYQATTKYLQNEKFFPAGANGLYSSILRKQLASSTPALVAVLKNRLKHLLNKHRKGIVYLDKNLEMDEAFLQENDLFEDFLIDEDLIEDKTIKEFDSCQERGSIAEEIQIINHLLELASKIKIDSKAIKLIEAINIIYQQLEEIPGTNKKILIFTESRKTQDFLFEILEKANLGNVLRFSGQNDFPEAKKAFEKWQLKDLSAKKNQATLRKAIVEEFKTSANILIATEAAAEGLNLQFCSVVINYDLPWNPQRIEQRIGRCHRYGQESDVTVFNFINSGNQIDMKVYELLDLKFKVFNGLLGSSDEILGLLEQGSDLEKKLMQIYLNCRSKEEIDREFELLSQQFSKEISAKLANAKKTLMENFDEDVANIFKKSEADFKSHLKNIENYFWELCKILLSDCARFNESTYSFELVRPYEHYEKAKYQLNSAYNYNPQSQCIPLKIKDSLGKSLIQQALQQQETMNCVEFDLTNYPAKISGLEPHIGKNGYLKVVKLKVSGKDSFERLLVTSVPEGDYEKISDQLIEKLFNLNGVLIDGGSFKQGVVERLEKNMELKLNQETRNISMEHSLKHKQRFQQINREASIQQKALNQEILDLVKQRQELEEIINGESIDWDEIMELEKQRELLQSKIKKLRQELTDREDEIEKIRRKKLQEFQATLEFSAEDVFMIKYKII